MSTITVDTTVGDIVRNNPGRSRIFENLGIDYCCGGKKPLAEACQAKGLDATTVAAMLSALSDSPAEPTTAVDSLTLSQLCDRIESVHHAYLREELPRLDFMTRKVAAVHGDGEPRLLEVRRIFESFHAEMLQHANEEEQVAFPAIRQLESTAATAVNLLALLGKLESEHSNVGEMLSQFRELTNNYNPPEWACNTFRALYHGLKELETRTHQHVHEENNVLFPKALSRN